jgi:general stress protein YciG
VAKAVTRKHSITGHALAESADGSQDLAPMSSKKSKRGFAAIDPEQQKVIAARGGKAAHAQGRAHEFTSEEARKAGSKGGKATARDKEHMAEIGRKGGLARKRKPGAAKKARDPE